MLQSFSLFAPVVPNFLQVMPNACVPSMSPQKAQARKHLIALVGLKKKNILLHSKDMY